MWTSKKHDNQKLKLNCSAEEYPRSENEQWE